MDVVQMDIVQEGFGWAWVAGRGSKYGWCFAIANRIVVKTEIEFSLGRHEGPRTSGPLRSRGWLVRLYRSY